LCKKAGSPTDVSPFWFQLPFAGAPSLFALIFGAAGTTLLKTEKQPASRIKRKLWFGYGRP
jgi:hypothetical protein